MSLDRNKVLEAAQKYLAKGQYDKAIAEYQKVLQADPKDVRTLLKIGDIHTKKGSTREACDAYLKVGEAYTQQGFHLKAVAVYKQILKLDPHRVDVYLKLAANYEQLELTSDALQTYEQVAAVYMQRGDIDKALQMLGKMTQLDPQNLPVRIRYAEALSKANRTTDAAREFEFGANLLKQQGRIEDYIKVAERLLFHRAEDVALARELAQLYLERNDGKRALAKLQVCFKANPKDTGVLDLLAQAFLKLDQKGKAISVYREIAKYHQEARRSDERARVLKRILELDPSDAEARQALAGYAAPAPRPIPAEAVVPPTAVVGSVRAELPKGPTAPVAPPPPLRPPTAAPPVFKPPTAIPPRPPTAAPPVPPPFASTAPEVVAPPPPERRAADLSPPPFEEAAEPVSEEVVVIEEEEELEAAPAASSATSMPPRASVPPAHREAHHDVPPDVALDAQVARLLTECDVFARYGLKQKILDQLERVVELAPHHVEARERLKDAYLEAGRTDDAVQQLLALGELFVHERPQLAQLYLKQVLLLDPENIDARAMMRPSVIPPPVIPHAAPASAGMATPVPTGEPEPESRDEGVVFVEDEGSGPLIVPEDEASGPVLMPEDEAGAEAVDEDLPTGPAIPKPESVRPAPRSEPAPSLVRALTQSTEMELRSEPPRMAPPEPQPEPEPYVEAPPEPEPYVEAPPAPEPYAPAEEPSGLAPMTPEEFEAAPVQPPSEAPPPASSSVEVEEILDEAEFYVAQGLWEEALSTIRDALASHPTHPILLDKLAEIEEAQRASEASQAAETAPPPSDDDAAFALAEKLAEELGPATEAPGHDVIDVENVFAQFKKGVEAQIDASDSETHYDLGIAYKEMGLLDDAVHEFDLAMRNADKECIAATMIGLCRIEQGRPEDSIQFFERALGAKHRDAREKLGLWFELGNAYGLLSKKTEALGYYQKVKAMDPSFRGVDERIRALSAPPAVAKVEVDPEDDELDKAFDELLGD